MVLPPVQELPPSVQENGGEDQAGAPREVTRGHRNAKSQSQPSNCRPHKWARGSLRVQTDMSRVVGPANGL